VVSEVALLSRAGDELSVEPAWTASSGEQAAAPRLRHLLGRPATGP
jgi:hypothetical protein